MLGTTLTAGPVREAEEERGWSVEGASREWGEGRVSGGKESAELVRGQGSEADLPPIPPLS